MPETRPACLAPWRSLTVSPDGEVYPDIQYSTSMGNLEFQSLREIFLGDSWANLRSEHLGSGRLPRECENCRLKEAAVGHSRRKFFFDKLERYEDKALAPGLKYLDINLSNKCNLKCRMCNSISSTSWIEEENKLAEKGFHFNLPKNPGYSHISEAALENLLNDREMFSDLRYVALRGGEPFLERANTLILEKFIEWGMAGNIRLDISTNGTGINREIVELINEYSGVDLYISLEGVGQLYRYIRGGTRFSINELEEQLPVIRSVRGAHVMFTLTLSLYNLFSLNSVWDWFNSVRGPGEDILLSNTVVRPEYLNFHILPKDLKAEVKRGLIERKCFTGPEHESGRPFLASRDLNKLLKNMESEPFSPEEKLRLFKTFLNYNGLVDEFRGEKFPEGVFGEWSPGQIVSLLEKEIESEELKVTDEYRP